ncbi:MAG: GntR family transcriptional regulator [Oscillospiraceae bacterium]|nr:GntR family transcriptional regulator [Oscillospiraceae bacterium]
MFSINIQGGKPIYEQLYTRISELILSGSMAPDEKLPPIREVAKDMGINPNTVQKTYQLLEQNGLIYSVPAKGSYVCKLTEESDALASLRKKSITQFKESAINAINHGVSAKTLHEEIDSIKEKQQ